MELRPWALVLLLLIAGTTARGGPPAAQATGAPFSLAIPGEAPAFQGGLPMLVAGVWHDLRVSDGGGSWDVLLTLPGAPLQDEGSYYRWSNAGGWHDVAYDHYVDAANSSTSPQGFSLRMGVSVAAALGTWHLRISGPSGAVLDADILVAEARVSAAYSGDDFTLRVDPYTPGRVDARASGQRFRLYNDGNVPLEANATFDHYGERIEVTGLGPTLGIAREALGSLVLNAPSWSPRVINLGATLEVHAAYTIPPRTGARLLPRLEVPFGVHILVAHEGMSLASLGGSTYQWPRVVRAAPDGQADLTLYFDGSEDLELTVRPLGARILSMDLAGSPARNPVLISLTPGAELTLRVRVALGRGEGARIDYTLRSLATSATAAFNTTLEADGEPQPPAATSAYGLPLGLATIATLGMGAVVYAARSQWRASRGRRRGRAGRPRRPAPRGERGRGGGGKGGRRP